MKKATPLSGLFAKMKTIKLSKSLHENLQEGLTGKEATGYATWSN